MLIGLPILLLMNLVPNDAVIEDYVKHGKLLMNKLGIISGY